MAKNYVQEGDILDHSNASGSAIASGTVVKFGVRIGVAVSDIPDGQSGAIAVSGVFSLPKLASDVVAQGALLYWDASNSRLTTTASDNTLAGYAAKAAGAGAATVEINLNK